MARPVGKRRPPISKGPKWTCLRCKFKFNTLARKRCKLCGTMKKGTEVTWNYE